MGESNNRIGEHYQIQHKLGEGGMGIVYQGIDTRTNETVAIKQLKADVTNAEMLERFKREGEALRELNHPNIVKMLDAFELDGSHYLVMEYVSGGDLRQTLKEQGKLELKQVLNIAIDLADALTRAHRLDIIHRDLKPENVLIADDGTVRLTDFGVARLGQLERMTDTDATVGTIDYLAPEALSDESIDQRADIWAFGVVLAEMLIGENLFSRQGIGATLAAILYDELPDLEMLMPDGQVVLIDLIYRMLERDPHSRISSVRYVGAGLEDLLVGRERPGRFETLHPEGIDFGLPKHNLPSQPTPFIGRERELAELTKLLDNPDTRLITILAPGGMGKSRLALELGLRYLKDTKRQFLNGVFFVELATLSSVDNIPSAIGKATGYHFQSNQRPPRQQILDFLGNKDLLLILDNFEHLRDEAKLVTDILQSAPDVTVLVTSRERLTQPGEVLFHLSGMDFPEWKTPEDALEYAAVKLFVNSAKRALPSFELTSDNLDYVTQICRLVAGMPLGIVLSAAWLGTLSVQEISEELQQSMDILEDDAGQVSDRQHSIRAVMEYSWHTMTDAEQQIFMKMSVFRGGMSRKAAQTVCGASLRDLMSLVNKSLIRRDNDTGRYQIHELLRQYAEEQLNQHNEAQETRDAHMAYYANAIHQREIDLKGSRQIEASQNIALDFENIRVAWRRANQQQDHAYVNLMHFGLNLYCLMTDRLLEGLELLQQALDWLSEASVLQQKALWGRVLASQAQIHNNLNHDPQIGYDKAELALQIATEIENPLDIAIAKSSLGTSASDLGYLHQNRNLAHEAVTTFQQLGEDFYELIALNQLGYAYYVRGTPEQREQGVKYWLDGAQKGRELGEKFWLSILLLNLGVHAAEMGDVETEKKYYLECLRLRRELGSDLRQILHNLWDLYMQEGDSETAEVYLQELLRYAHDINTPSHLLQANGTLALHQFHKMQYAETIATLEEVSARFSTEVQGVFHVQKLVLTGMALVGLGKYSDAATNIYESLSFIDRLTTTQLQWVVVGVGLSLICHEDQPERGLELLAMIKEHYPRSFAYDNQLIYEVMIQLKETLTPDAFQAAWERGKSLDLESVVQQLAEEFGAEDDS